jgi:hypothetical protein
MLRVGTVAMWAALALAAQACAGAGGSITGSAGNPGTGNTGTAGTSNPGGGGNPGTAGTSSGNPGTGGGGTAGVTGTGGSSPNFTLACQTASLGTPILRLLTRTELINTLGDTFPEVRTQWTHSLPASTISAYGFDNESSATVGNQLASAVLDTAKSVGTAVTGTAFATILPCSSAAADRNCAGTFIDKYGKRLFRRALTTEERNRYLELFDASRAKAPDFKTTMKWLTVALIQSPHTLYRSEIGTVMGDGTRQLTPYEVATELAYTYTGTTPSDALLTAAGSGSLGDVAAMARSMIGTPAGKQMMQRFFEQYLDYSSVGGLQKPKISTYAGLAADMVEETRAFVEDVVMVGGGGMKELLTATTTNPSRRLATYYGTGNMSTTAFPVPATDYAKVTRPANTGVGILAQGSFLATHASSDASSPTKRGLFPFYRLFCMPKLSPPDNVPPLDTTTQVANVNTTRDRYEKLHGLVMGPTGTCATCHQFFDPPGFAFEHFDEGGRYRAKETTAAGTFDINAAGTMKAPDGTMISFTSQETLMAGLANQPVIHQCLSAYLAAYAFGSSEACIGASQVNDLRTGTIGIAEAFARLATEPHFTKRNAQ